MINTIITNFDKIAASIAAACFAAYLVYRNNKKSRIANAAEKFRSIVHKSLEGIYPDNAFYISPAEKNNITWNSINCMNSAGSEFSHNLSIFCKGRFVKALANYCETARKTDWNNDIAFEMYRKSMANPGELSPGENFRKAVKHLLSFAKEK